MVETWTINLHHEVEAWFLALDGPTAARVEAAIDALEAGGPSLGRPLVDHITNSRHPHMKELRTGTVRILFAFDPQRQAILLIAGDKKGAWNLWYQTAIPEADDRYNTWLTQQKGSPS